MGLVDDPEIEEMEREMRRRMTASRVNLFLFLKGNEKFSHLIWKSGNPCLRLQVKPKAMSANSDDWLEPEMADLSG